MYKNINKLSTVFKNNHTYLIGAFTLFSLFGIVLILLGAITKNINWVYSSIAVLIISFIIAYLIIVLGIFAIIDAVKERKLKKALILSKTLDEIKKIINMTIWKLILCKIMILL